MTGTDDVDEYLAKTSPEQQATLGALRSMLRSMLPRATEELRYGMPAFVLDTKAVAGYAAAAGHCSYFPMSGDVLTAAGSAVDGYSTSKGGLRFPSDQRLPKTLVRTLVKLRLAELSSVTTGKRIDYFDDGTIKAQGRMRSGQLHGSWEWFRKDGTRMRSGSFANGEPTGTWTTWDRDGRAVTVTKRT